MFCLLIPTLCWANKTRQLSPIDTLVTRLDSAMFKEAHAREVSPILRELGPNQSNRKELIPDSLVIDLQNYVMPIKSRTITSKFGPRNGRMHKGLDIGLHTGDTVRAAFSGEVSVVRYEPKGYGYYVAIKHENGLTTLYAHLSKQLVKLNQIVKAGTPIGLGGSTGRSTGPHLHFETRVFGIALDPQLMFDFPKQQVVHKFFVFKKNKYIKTSR